MNHNWLKSFWFLCVAGLILPVQAQLEFVQVTNANLPKFNLLGVTYGGASNSVFVAVGAGAPVLTWSLTNSGGAANQNLNWVSASKGLPGSNYLDAATFGANQFVASGSNNVIFSSADGIEWTTNGKAFSDTYTAKGLAFNNGTFVIVSSAPEISWSTNIASTPWNSANIAGVSPFDSYHGVTAFNSTNWAACGDYGTLAISTNGVQNWTEPYGAFVESNLLGIAWDGHQTVVCVGGNEEILAFTNGGPFGGPPGSSNSWGSGNLNAVSYMGTNISFSYLGSNDVFMAVGDVVVTNSNSASVLVSPDGASWMRINTNDPTLKANTNRLNGVFFATSGQFKGIGVLVGDHGTIILAGTPPQAPSDITPAQTNCAGEINSSLGVEFNTNDFPVGALVVDWSTNAGFSTLATNISTVGETNYFVPPVVTTNITITNVYYVRTRDIRTSLSSTSIMVTNIVYRQPAIAGDAIDSPICNGNSDAIVLNLTGDPPWTVMWSDGAVSNYTASPAFRYLSALEVTNVFQNAQTNYMFVVTNLTDMYCTAQSNNQFIPSFNPLASNKVSVSVIPLPTSVLTSFTNTTCNSGNPVILTNVLTGLGPWTVIWSSNNLQVAQPVTNEVPGPFTNTFTVFPTNTLPDSPFTNVYYVLSVSNNATTCLGNQPGDISTNQVSIIVDPVAAPPTINGNMTSCYNVAVPLSVSVPPGFTADWYSNLTLVASGTNIYVPPVPIDLGTNSSLTNTYIVFARFIDPNLTNCYSVGVNVSLISLLCTNEINSISKSGTNAIIQWTGNFVLQNATNLTPPATWMNLTTGGLGANAWTNSMMPPPTNNFFRLYAPTN